MLFYLFSVINQDNGKKMLGLQHFFENEIRDSKFSAAQTSYDYLRNELDFWKVHGIMNTSGLLQSK